MLKQFSRYELIIVTVLFLSIEFIINPIGEFPLNDDWAYSKSVLNYLNSGQIQPSSWQGFPDLPRLFISAAFCKLFGFSFTLLRFVTIGTFLTVIFVFYRNLKTLGINPSLRLGLLLLLAFNPLSLNLCNTYMSDVFQLLLTLICFQFMLLFLKTGKSIYFFSFTAVSLLATLNRQISLVLPLAFGIAYFFISSENKKRVLFSSIPVLINYFVLFAYEHWAQSENILPGNYYIQFNNIISAVTHPSVLTCKKIAYYFITSTISLGLFILPFTINNIKLHITGLFKNRISVVLFSGYIVLIILKLILSGKYFPFVGNIFYHLGAGPIMLNGFNTDELPQLSLISAIIYSLFSFIGGISFAAAFYSILNNIKNKRNDYSCISGYIFVLLLLLYLLPLCFSYANDRYLLLLLPFFFIAYILSYNYSIQLKSFLLVFIPVFYFSFSSAFNYLSINKARARAASHLLNELSIKPDQIDGGFEFNGWYLSGINSNYDPGHKGQWWWVDNDDYVISPVKLNGYSVESEYKFSALPPFNFSKVCVLKRD